MVPGKAADYMLRLKFGGVALTALLSVALAGCGGVRVASKAASGQQQPAAAQFCDRDQAGDGRVVVCRGDTLLNIARLKNVTVANLKRVNGLTSDRILAGSILILPDEYVYVVQPGDTLLDVSRSTGVSTADLMAANELTNPDRLLPETRLAIPRSDTQIAQMPAPAQPTGPASVMPERTAPSLVRTPSVTIGTPAATAPASPVAPAPETTQRRAEPTVAATAPAPPAAQQQPAGPQPRQRPAEPAQKPAAQPAPQQAAKATPSAPPSSTPAFLLPAEGRILSDFGPKSGGLHNDGINIAAPRGTPIRATADGSIAYAGDGLPGFGNLILIRHADGWTSAYAHADTMTVKRGDTVRQGQTIGTVGDTGSVSEPQLHFELRQHDRAVDPKTMVR